MTTTPFLELVIRGTGTRLVLGHPIRPDDVMKDGKKVLDDAGMPKKQIFYAVAVPKGVEVQAAPAQSIQPQDAWKLTEWGQQIVARAQQDWPSGEWQYPLFSWKIEDGDSVIPNKNNKKNCERDGMPGHWILKCSTQLVGTVKAWDATSPNGAMTEILDANAIKCGDYCDVAIQVRGNAPSQTSGVYLNPSHFVFTRAGTPIAGGGGQGASASELFGRETTGLSPNAAGVPVAAVPAPAATAMAPAGSMPAPTSAPAYAPPAPAPAVPAAVPAVTPHNDFLNVAAASTVAPAPAPVEENYNVNGTVYTRAQLEGSGWTAEQIQATPRA